MSEIDSRRDLTAQYVGELQVAYDKIQQQLSGPAEGRTDAVAVPLLPFRGALDWPTTGRIGSRFGQTEGRLGGSAVKNGVEIASTEDLPVRAVHGGTVAYADAFTGLGTLVILDHGAQQLLAVRLSRLGDRPDGRPGGNGRRNRPRRRIASWAAGALFRAQDRRQTDRSRTMAEASITPILDDPCIMGVAIGSWEFSMTSRTRLWVLAISTPVIVFALVGGYLGQAMAKDDTYQHLRVFDDVVTHVVNNYVEEVDLKQAMRGAMRGLAEALDADSAFLTPELVRTVESNSSAGPGRCGHRAGAAVLPAGRVGSRGFSGGQGRPAHRRLHPRDRQQADARHVRV